MVRLIRKYRTGKSPLASERYTVDLDMPSTAATSAKGMNGFARGITCLGIRIHLLSSARRFRFVLKRCFAPWPSLRLLLYFHGSLSAAFPSGQISIYPSQNRRPKTKTWVQPIGSGLYVGAPGAETLRKGVRPREVQGHRRSPGFCICFFGSLSCPIYMRRISCFPCPFNNDTHSGDDELI